MLEVIDDFYVAFLVCVALDDAEGYWRLLIPHGLSGGALSHIISEDEDEGEDEAMAHDEEGWQPEYTEWWFDFLKEKGGKGVSKDTWLMVCPILPSFSFLVFTIRSFLTFYDTSSWSSSGL